MFPSKTMQKEIYAEFATSFSFSFNCKILFLL